MQYRVTITRTESKRKTFVVRAETPAEAKVAALDDAADCEWERGEADYEVEAAIQDDR